jgi:hypothetical protein
MRDERLDFILHMYIKVPYALDSLFFPVRLFVNEI